MKCAPPVVLAKLVSLAEMLRCSLDLQMSWVQALVFGSREVFGLALVLCLGLMVSVYAA